MEEVFKDSDFDSLISIRIQDIQLQDHEELESHDVSPEDIQQFNDIVISFVQASESHDKMHATQHSKDLLEGLQYYGIIPYFNFIADNKVVQICGDYYNRYPDGDDEIGCNCLGILACLSHQSSDYLALFAPILPILFKKISKTMNFHKNIQLETIGILSNCMLDSKLVRIFDNFSIIDFNKNFVEQINSSEEAETVARFYNIYLEEKGPKDIFLDIFHHLTFILSQEISDNTVLYILNILARLADTNCIDFQFLFDNQINDFLSQQVSNPRYLPLVIYFYSRCFYFDEEFRKYNIFDINTLISYIICDEHDEYWFKRAAATTNFLTTLAYFDALDDNNAIVCAKWICEGIFEAVYSLKEPMLYLMLTILMKAGPDFIRGAYLPEVFGFLNETIGIKFSRNHLIYACESLLSFVNTAEVAEIDIQEVVRESSYVDTISDLLDDCENGAEIFDVFRAKFCS